MYVVVGDNGRDQVVNLNAMMSAITHKKSSILWCYKKELGFSSHQKKRAKEFKKNVRTGLHDSNLDDPFDSFQKTNDIRYCFYRDTEQILGKTFGMCVLQDFEALTPNILCRTIETVEGGGIIVLLLRTMSSLRQLYSVTMDMHRKYSESEGSSGLFNERFILSLGGCKNVIVMDDEMNILPLSMKAIENLKAEKESNETHVIESESRGIAEVTKLATGVKPVGDVVIGMSRTTDQARAVLEFTQTLSSGCSVSSNTTSSIRRLCCLTSGRGRGKSAALGMAIGSAVAFGYSNIIVTAPSNDNVTTVFEFITKTLDALGFRPHIDYVEICQQDKGSTESVQSIYSSMKGSRKLREIPNQIIINKNNHRQTIQFVPANECSVSSACEVLIIDEAAAIPLPIVKALVSSGNHLTLMSSTVHGYEGTGRALSLKLIDELKRNPSFIVSESHMETPIRYALNDGIEKWLHDLLCLDATEAPALKQKLVSPTDCKLYLINRKELFSHHKGTEKFLRRLMSLFVSSHYKNSPDDLMLMSDAPKHQVLAFLPPVAPGDEALPEVYVAIQIALEGKIGSRSDVLAKSSLRPNGDMIPWTLSLQYSDTDFGQLNGIRIVRIAVHPKLARMGYGSEAMRQLLGWVDGMAGMGKVVSMNSTTESSSEEQQTDLKTEELKPRKHREPFLCPVTESESVAMLFGGSNCEDSQIDFVGTSFGLTLNLFNFWKKSGFLPLYIRQTRNDTTGEFTTMMLRANDTEWLDTLYRDFAMRFMRLLSGPFKCLSSELALSLLVASPAVQEKVDPMTLASTLVNHLSLYDIRRLRSYARGETDYHLITDLVPVLAELVFRQIVTVNKSMPFLAKRILVGMGCQRKSIDEVYEEDKARITIPQILGIFKPAVDKITTELEKALESKIKEQFNERKNKFSKTLPKTVPTPSGPMALPADAPALPEQMPQTPSTSMSDPSPNKKHKLHQKNDQYKKKTKH
jgi:N-acetyltransferase 10